MDECHCFSLYWICTGAISYLLNFFKGPSGGAFMNGDCSLKERTFYRSYLVYRFLFFFHVAFDVTWHSFLLHYSILILSCLDMCWYFSSISSISCRNSLSYWISSLYISSCLFGEPLTCISFFFFFYILFRVFCFIIINKLKKYKYKLKNWFYLINKLLIYYY